VRKTGCWTPILVFATALGVNSSAAANSVSVNGAAALGHQATGSIACGGQECGLAVSYDGPPSLALVQNSAMNDEAAVSIRFLIDPGVAGDTRFRMACGGSIRILLLFQDFTPGTGIKVVLFLKQNSESSGAWRLAAYVREDTGPFVFGGEGYLTGLTPVSSTLVELEWGAATAPGANNGFLRGLREHGGAHQPRWLVPDRWPADGGHLVPGRVPHRSPLAAKHSRSSRARGGGNRGEVRAGARAVRRRGAGWITSPGHSPRPRRRPSARSTSRAR
jgi:hypothetical protein